jgi:crotonobetainyl-CoA:carnitine CoA-transferase CaiB-like acyl-CoA transferase
MPAFWSLEDAGEWDGAIVERVKERDLDEWVERGRANPDLPFEPIVSAEQALDHPQLRHNGDVVTVVDPDHGPIEQIGPVGHFSATPSRIERPAPALDAHGPRPESSSASDATGELPEHALAGSSSSATSTRCPTA